ncbi:MAG: Holliday junction resolvase RuvX [Alistipes sp.]|nr:Holliday junction resolvase RuvX [Alistipes sp.]
MSRIIAIDWGTKRTGLAATDPLRIVANSLATVPTHELQAWLAQYMAAEDVDVIVVGRPTRMDGSPSETLAPIESLVKRLRTQYPGKQVVMHDERFTSRLAWQAIRDGGVPKLARRDKSLVDRVSATIILQSYLESREYKKSL